MAARSGESTCSGTSRSPLRPEALRGALSFLRCSLWLCVLCMPTAIPWEYRDHGGTERTKVLLAIFSPTCYNGATSRSKSVG